MLIEHDGLGCAGLENPLFLLGQADGGQVGKPQLLECAESRTELALAPVDENQVWKLPTFFQNAAIASENDLAHGREVVGLTRFHASDLVLAVVAPFGLTSLERDHRRDRLTTLDVGDIEPFDTLGPVRKLENFTEGIEPLARLAPLLAEIELVGESGVPAYQLDEPSFPTALGA